ncbi:MAG TPA: MFS transporter [Actinomycetota bacterium]|nr:MFS transporter [Actinomycetota bacterium]
MDTGAAGDEGQSGSGLARTQKRWTMVAVVLGSAVVFLDSTIVNVALPKIGQDLPSRWFRVLEGQSFVYNAYLLALSSLLILAGALNDHYGRKRIFAIGLFGFGLTSVLCGVAPNLDLLVVFRVLQGVAGAMVVPGALSIISVTFEGEERGRAFGIWAAGSAATTISGPFIGGLLVDEVSWRAAFLIAVPVVVLSFYATLKHIEESRDEDASGDFDWLGAAVTAVGVGGLTLGLIRGQERGWDAASLVIIATGAAGILAFPFLMSVSRHPLVPLALFRSRDFSVLNTSTLVIWGALYVLFYVISLFTQGTLGYTAAAAGVAGVPGIAFMVAFSSRFGQLAASRGPRAFISVGPLLMGLGVLWLSRTPSDSQPWRLTATDASSFLPPVSYLVDLLPAFLLFGVGAMMTVAPVTAAVMGSVPTSKAGVASAINNAISRIGPQLIGAAVFVAVTATFYSSLADRVPAVETSSSALREAIAPLNRPTGAVSPEVMQAAREASTEAFHVAMRLSAACMFLGAIINFVGIRRTAPAEVPELVQPAAGLGKV